MLVSLSILVYFLASTSAQFNDEIQVYEKECLGENRFHCGDGGCIYTAQHCDGNVDCENGADEHMCVIHPQDPSSCNGTERFLCADGKQCIPNIWLCDNVTHCEDGSDELNCTDVEGSPNSTCKGFTCASDRRCISRLWACDGVYDCQDRSDENTAACHHAHHFSAYDPALCSSPVHTRDRVSHECDDKSYCLPERMFCDGMPDCKDGSDEGEFCANWHIMCKNFTCGNDSHSFCVPDRTGPTCYCDNAAQYNNTTRTCDIINMCEEARPYCTHQCEFKGGPFKCSCDEGYVIDALQIGHACFAPDPEPLLFVATRTAISYIKLKSQQVVTLSATTKEAHGVTSDGHFVYWVETADGHEEIARAKIDDFGDKEVVVGLGLEDPGDVAIDWQGGHIYFSDAERGIISACHNNGNICTTIKTDARVPKFVTLDPRNGKMYWADWHTGPVIMGALMDGTQHDVVVSSLETFPSGLALDAPSQRLYFVDRTVKGVHLANGKVFTLFDEPMYRPYALSVFENAVYWSDWGSNTVQAADKATGQPLDRQLYQFTSAVMGMHMYHPILSRAKHNPCDSAGCSHFCFVTSNVTFSCGCPDGYRLDKNRCSMNPEYRPTYLVVGSGARFTRIQYHAFGSPTTDLTDFDIGRVQAMAYDSIRDTLYVYDGYRKSITSIKMADFRSGKPKLMFLKGFENVIDMDYDYISDALYILDAGHKHIMAISLVTLKQAFVYRFGDETPISLCLVPDYGKMLVAVRDSAKDEIHIDSLGLDGSDRQNVIMNDLKGPAISMRYAHNLNRVYIADEGNHIIQFMNPDGSDRKTFRELSTSVISIAATDELVLWAGRGAARLYWAPSTLMVQRLHLASFPNGSLHLQSTGPPPPGFSHGCSNHRSCADVCVQTPAVNGSTGFKCLCEAGWFDLDGVCTEAVKCKEFEAFCHQSNQCVPKRVICDGKKDCYHGEDEEDCPAPTTGSTNQTSCASNEIQCNGLCVQGHEACSPSLTVPILCTSAQFACTNDNLCIARSQMCNSVPDCPDGSDEAKILCRTLNCLHTEFMCSSGSCILNSWRCDGEDDCGDGSDEVNCGRETCSREFFQCRNSECVPLNKRCDHNSDCGDYSDEEGCFDTDVVDVQEELDSCAPWEFACQLNTSICVPLTARCNGKVDCPGSTDEVNCRDHCAPRGLFQCAHEGHCVDVHRLCNGHKDCADGSDETPLICDKVNRTSRFYPIHYFPIEACHDGYSCESGQCVEWREVCDYQYNCFDGTDESPLCLTACNSNKCSHICAPTPKGSQCRCPSGYTLANSTTCLDIDECVNEPCSQRCHNVPGSFVCTCHPGYAIRSDSRSCKAVSGHMSILYTSDNSVRSLEGDAANVEFNDPTVGSISDIDCDVRRKKLYVTSAEGRKLMEVNATYDTVATITNIGRPTKVATDWITGNVYFLDETPPASRVRVCNVQKQRCATLQRLPANSVVTSLVVDPSSRLMFYCVSHQQESVVWSASLAGRNVQDIATVHNCTGLAVDSFKRRLYVAQNRPDSVTVMDFHGGGRKIILQNDIYLDSPHSLAIFEDHIYYLISNSHRLNRCTLYGQKKCEIYLQRIFNPNTFVIKHKSVQRMDLLDICEAYPCDGICVMDISGPVCLCEDGSTYKDGCPQVGNSELPLFNGWTHRDVKTANSATNTVIISLLTVFGIYLVVFLYYRFVYKRKPRGDNYVPVHFQNSLTDIEYTSPLVSPLVMPPMPIGDGRSEFANPFEFAKQTWSGSFGKPSKPVGSTALQIEVPDLDVSDTESDLDEKEQNRIIIRRKSRI